MGTHWIGSSIDLQYEIENYEEKADSIFRELNYRSLNDPVETRILTDGLDLDSLQRKYGSKDLIRNLRNENSFPGYTPQVSWLDGTILRNSRASVDISQSGELVGFSVSPGVVNEQTPFNKWLINHAIRQTVGKQVNAGTVDTLLSGLVEFQHNRENTTNFNSMKNVVARLSEGTGTSFLDEYLSDKGVWWAVDYYISQSFWKRFDFRQDSLVRDEQNGFKFVKAYLTSMDTVLGVTPTLEVDILPAGSLYKLDPGYFSTSYSETATQKFLKKALLFLVFAFMVWLLMIFYLRIKARAVDTRPAFIVAFITGFMASLLFILDQVGNSNFEEVLKQQGLMDLFFVMGIIGALCAIAFFLLTAVSDSVTRQYWPEKLKTWDLVRRGMFNNKPVGWAIIRGISMGGILIGVYVILIDLIPGTYVNSKILFSSFQFLFGSVANLIINLLISLVIIVSLFMVIGNQVKAKTQKIWIIPLASGLCFFFALPLNLEIIPFNNGQMINFVIGYVLGVFYIYTDFVTVTITFFTFLNLILTKQGWLVSGSPDFNVFVVFVFITILLMSFAFIFVVTGNERDELPDYVPDYLEDLAKEQRVTQELEIARTVQKTFLPNTTPDIPGFDTAAICEPAQDTGGDYYDIICLDDDKAAIAIGDVSGKGIQAAFYMTFIKGVIHSLSSVFPSPKMMLYRVNRLFNQNATRGTFISMIYGVLDPENRTFKYIRAGHNPILLKKANGEMAWLQPKGVAIGMAKGEFFNKAVEEDTISIEKGDVLILYTDGITEAQNEQEEFYDEKRLFKLLKREKTDSAKELRDLIIKDVRTFMGNALQYDDMTLVVIKG